MEKIESLNMQVELRAFVDERMAYRWWDVCHHVTFTIGELVGFDLDGKEVFIPTFFKEFKSRFKVGKVTIDHSGMGIRVFERFSQCAALMKTLNERTEDLFILEGSSWSSGHLRNNPTNLPHQEAKITQFFKTTKVVCSYANLIAGNVTL